MEVYRISGGKTVQRFDLTEPIDAFFETSSFKTSTLETYRIYSRTASRLLGYLKLDEIDRKTVGEFESIRYRTLTRVHPDQEAQRRDRRRDQA